MAAIFTARYDGRCGICPKPIRAGDTVTYVDDELVHNACATDDDPTQGDLTKVCNTCNTIHAGECW
ncbi:hypothetical protein [Mycolicibacterium canariasense]|uniref:hypothetical protein n=1 Tax=Mycolicibacterium canariasense TaxID=228230 RepID=UPI000A14A181|nr:hypothetical protein [Mycolicibacterium canariasense]MCV7208378.1 hypothetical protein [Mycolicibacterium canariasense]ORV13562.1 hypothetical protein AWB94_04895 [Mycolicibacterium canariasense]